MDASHGHGLIEDLERLEADLRQRRRQALAWMAGGAGAALLCGAVDSRAAGRPGRPGGGSGGGSGTGSGSGSTACLADPTETAGPYPADGSNTAGGATSDILTASGIVRSDIRSSFIGSAAIAQGVLLTLTLNVVNSNASCTPLAGYAVYLWQCDRAGTYSLYTAPAESWLRGVQVADAAGQVTFTTIVPGCYAGRWPHLHVEVFASLDAATAGRNAVLTSQLAMPSAVCSAVYAGASGYGASVANFARISIAGDNVFRDNSAAQIAVQTPALTGSVASGYSGSATIALGR